MKRITSVTAALLIAAIHTGRATIINNDFGLANPTTIVTFSEHILADQTTLAAQYADFGLSFSNLFYQTTANITPAHLAPPAAANFHPGITAPNPNPASLLFATPQTAVAFTLASSPGTGTFTAFLGGTQVETATFATGLGSTNYYAFTGITFDRIQFQIANGDRAAFIDNIQVPEPTTIGLLVAGALAVGPLRRRRLRA